MELTVKSAFSDAGSFFGLMCMCAAHRAVLSGRHSDLIDVEGSARSLYDPDYYIMKDRCIREMEAKVRDPNRAISNEAFDTIVSLLTSAVSTIHFPPLIAEALHICYMVVCFTLA